MRGNVTLDRDGLQRVRDDFAASVGLKQKRLWVTVCHDETVRRACRELCDNSTLRRKSRLVYAAL